MPVQTASAWDRLHAVHPHHTARLSEHVQAMKPGAVVTIQSHYAQPNLSSFYHGMHKGDTVVVTGLTMGGRSVQNLAGNSPHLSIYASGDVAWTAPVLPSEWTHEHAKAAQSAAEKAALESMERAYASANGLIGAPAGPEAAIAALHEAKELRDFAFAAGVLAAYIKDPAW